MLEIRPNCECCNKNLAFDAKDALICSFECTFCAHCVATKLNNKCPNCGGTFSNRPIRPKDLLKKFPASDLRVLKSDTCL